jgi:hypothetical protein
MVAPLPDCFRILRRIRLFCFTFQISALAKYNAFGVPKAQVPYFMGF